MKGDGKPVIMNGKYVVKFKNVCDFCILLNKKTVLKKGKTDKIYVKDKTKDTMKFYLKVKNNLLKK